MAIAEINDGRADVLADDQQELRGADSEGYCTLSDTRCLSGEDIAARSATSAPGVAPNHPVPNPATDQTTGEHSISRSNDDSNEEMCRICLEGPGPGKRLITPCWCSGSVRFVHKECLEGWLEWRGTPTCELCGYTFVIQRTQLTYKEWLSHSVNCNFMKEAIFLTFWCTFLALVNIMSIEPAVEGWRGSVKSDDLLPLIQLVLTTMAIGHNSYLLMKCCLKLYASMKYCCDNHTHVTLMEEKRLLPRRQIERPVPVNRLPGLVESDDRAQAVNDAANGGQEEDRTSLGASVLPIDGTSADFFSLSSLTFRLPQSTSFDGSGMDREMRQGMPRTSENCSLPVRIFDATNTEHPQAIAVPSAAAHPSTFVTVASNRHDTSSRDRTSNITPNSASCASATTISNGIKRRKRVMSISKTVPKRSQKLKSRKCPEPRVSQPESTTTTDSASSYSSARTGTSTPETGTGKATILQQVSEPRARQAFLTRTWDISRNLMQFDGRMSNSSSIRNSTSHSK